MSNKEIRADAKLKNLPEDQLEELWLLRHPLDGEDVHTYAEVQVELPRICGETASKSTLSEFYNWLSLKRDMEESYERGEQAKLKYLNANPDASPESVMAVGQMMFATKSMQTGDLDGFVKLLALAERKASREFNEEKFQSSLKSKLEAGLDALFEEIKGNEKAEAIFAELKGALES